MTATEDAGTFTDFLAREIYEAIVWYWNCNCPRGQQGDYGSLSDAGTTGYLAIAQKVAGAIREREIESIKGVGWAPLARAAYDALVRHAMWSVGGEYTGTIKPIDYPSFEYMSRAVVAAYRKQQVVVGQGEETAAEIMDLVRRYGTTRYDMTMESITAGEGGPVAPFMDAVSRASAAEAAINARVHALAAETARLREVVGFAKRICESRDDRVVCFGEYPTDNEDVSLVDPEILTDLMCALEMLDSHEQDVMPNDGLGQAPAEEIA